MTNEEIIRIFLKENTCYDAFKDARRLDGSYYKHNITLKIEKVIIHSFSWHYTYHGRDFWKRIDCRLVDMCRDLNLSGEVEIDKI